MEDYEEVETKSIPGEAHCCTSVLSDGHLLPKEYSLSKLLGGADPDVPDSYDPNKDYFLMDGKYREVLKSFVAHIGNDHSDVVVFNGGVFVILTPAVLEKVIPQKFWEQLDGDLIHYKTPIHRLPGKKEQAIKDFSQTAAWWRHHVRETYSRDDQERILRALFVISDMPYLSAGWPPAFTSTHATFQSKTDPLNFTGIVSVPIGYPHFGAYVFAREDTIKGWYGAPREYVLATIGMAEMRECKMQPRVDHIYHKKET